MMYLNGEHGFVKNFFERTKEIIEHSENFGCEVTLLCNCLTGLLVFLEQKFYDKMRTISLADENHKKLKVGLNGKNKPRSEKVIFQRMRNAVSHCNIKFESATNYKSDTKIKYIYFYDDKDYKNKRNFENFDFQLKIDIADLKEILINFCDELLKSEEYVK